MGKQQKKMKMGGGIKQKSVNFLHLTDWLAACKIDVYVNNFTNP